LAWNGSAGGVLAIDSQNLITSGGATVTADGLGFLAAARASSWATSTAGHHGRLAVNSNAKERARSKKAKEEPPERRPIF